MDYSETPKYTIRIDCKEDEEHVYLQHLDLYRCYDVIAAYEANYTILKVNMTKEEN